ncbi:MAG: response regulator, partial [Vibrio fluvialis]
TTPVVVVSGDIQPKAKERVLALGAKAFIQKPINKDDLNAVIRTLVEPPTQPRIVTPISIELPVLRRRDIYMEVANVSIGRAADALARHFDVFVQLPLPNVNIFEVSELHMALRDLADNVHVSGVCQGFSGEGIAGEALVLLTDSSVADLKKLMKVPADNEELEELELIMDVSNILVGSFLNGLGEQAEVRFFQSSPVLLGQHIPIDSVIQSTAGSFKKTMTFEVSYNIEGTSIRCDLLFMFVDESLPLLDSKLAYLMEDF